MAAKPDRSFQRLSAASKLSPASAMALVSVWTRIIRIACALGISSAHQASGSTAMPPPMERLVMRVGEDTEWTFAVGSDLTVSRRGVIDLYHLGDGRWQITALRSGVVVVEANLRSNNSHQLVRRTVIEVSPRPDRDGDRSIPSSVQAVPTWICASPHISCDESSGVVAGTTSDFRWFRRARAACRTARTCSFQVTLHPKALLIWRQQLAAALGEGFELLELPEQRFVASTFCGRGHRHDREALADALTDGALHNGDLVLNCQEGDSTSRYQLAARIFLVEESAASQLGFSDDTQLTLQAPNARATASVMAQLRALARERRAEIVGEPLVHLVANDTVRIMSGGEFQVADYNGDDNSQPRASWKQHGLQMNFTVTPLNATTARLAYELTLSAKASGSNSALNVNALTSSVDLKLAEPQVVALLNLKSEGQSSDKTLHLSNLPILGPLFRLVAEESSRSRLVAWLKLGSVTSRKSL